MYDIVTIGEILVEILAEKPDQEFSSPGALLGPFPSGAPAIAIDQAARMGAKTAILAKIGADDFGRLNRERLSASGVDVSHILETAGNTTGTAFVTYFSDGSRKFIFHFEHAACGELGPGDVSEELIKNTKYLHIMGCSVTGSQSMGEAIMHAISLAQKNRVKISFDPNIRPELLKGRVMDYYREIITAADILLAGKTELAFLFHETDTAIKHLLKQKERIIVIKNGAENTSVYTRHEAFKIPPFPAITLDATGAGDSFDGTFLAQLCRGTDLRTAALYGNAAGAKAVTKRGPMEGNTGMAELEEFVKLNPRIAAEEIDMLY
ncbi:MAG: sugar kinase [Treponema sp.]|nr:sugar kinase [Treponema sp.]